MRRRSGPYLWFALSFALLLPSCATDLGGRTVEPQVGTALAPMPDRWIYEVERPVPPNTTFTMVWTTLQNASDNEIIVESIEPVNATGLGHVARLEATRILPRERGGNDFFPWGRYASFPPSLWSRAEDRCVVAELVKADGFVIDPSDPDRVVTLLFRTARPGVLRFDAFRVTYRVKNDLYIQDFPFGMRIQVEPNAEPFRADGSERRCI